MCYSQKAEAFTFSEDDIYFTSVAEDQDTVRTAQDTVSAKPKKLYKYLSTRICAVCKYRDGVDPMAVSENADTNYNASAAVSALSEAPDTVAASDAVAAPDTVAAPVQEAVSEPAPEKKVKEKKDRMWPSFAVKTNLLYDVLSSLNIEFEVPIGRNWSVAASWAFPWFIYGGNKYCMELLDLNLEGRYWFQNRDRMLGGFFAGAYVRGGMYYDLQWLDNGVQGDYFFSTGLTGGYSLKLSEHLNMEFSLGIGYLVTEYDKYVMRDDYNILAFTEKGRTTWFGPTNAKVSLVWLIGQKRYATWKK